MANLWTNRLIADAALPEAKRLSWTNHPLYQANATRLPSGLLGPVALRAAQSEAEKPGSTPNP